jgi:exonuclease SbcC
MKIQQVRFRNLNSLVGEWTLDLTDPAYGADGIFAIIGPTGAGKSTILDAICLALYGRTPRLPVISKSGNDIMSRQTGDCFAEVTFSGSSGAYRCHWSHQRARKRVQGQLQHPKHEISILESGEILDSSLRGVAKLVEDKTGMDFDRFTRSMLLAQGGFSAFLQAHPDERAPILEQITGTQIYSDISKCVHQQFTAAQAALEAEQERYKDLIPLSPEEEQHAREDHQSLAAQDRALAAAARQRDDAIAWLRGLESLFLEQDALAQQHQQWQEDHATFTPQAEALARANRALELSADHARLVGLRQAQQEDRQTQAAKRAQHPNVLAAQAQAEQAHSQAEAAKSACQAEQDQLAPILRQVRTLDHERAETHRALFHAQQEAAKAQSQLDRLGSQQQADLASQAEKRHALEELTAHLVANARDAALVENLSGLEARAEALRILAQERTQKDQQSAQAEDTLRAAQQAQITQADAIAASATGLEQAQHNLAQADHALALHLGAKTEPQWRDEATQINRQQTLLVEAIHAARARQQAEDALTKQAEQATTLAAQQATLTSQCRQKEELLQAQQSTAETLERNLILLRRIANLEQARHHLHDGEACPLCGATDHPYARGQTPTPDAEEQRLAEVKATLKTLRDQHHALSLTLAGLEKEQQQNSAAQQEQSTAWAKAQQTLEALCPQITAAGLDPQSPTLLKTLTDTHHTLSVEASRIQDLLTQADQLRQTITTCRDRRDLASQNHQDCQTAAQQATHRAETAQATLSKAQADAASLAAQFTQALASLHQDCAPFGLTVGDLAALDHGLEILRQRRALWTQRQQQATALRQALDTLDHSLTSRAEQITQTQSARDQAQHQAETLTQTAARQDRDRQTLFADKDPDAEEQRLLDALRQATTRHEQTRQSLLDCQAAVRSLENSLAELEQRLADRQVPLDGAEQAFSESLRNAGFTDEAAYQASVLPDDQRRALADRHQRLTQHGQQITSQQAANAERITREQAKAITDQPLTLLLQAQTEAETQRATLHQTMGALAQKIADNERLKERLSSHASAIEARKQEATRWQALHELIGSADGKKFRNFAQGLTFDLMVAHANQQLRQMSDRYHLHRRQGSLDLDVIDAYQAGESRTTKNLSGGESFIVSLALALGLSKMASQNARVDSLFLDEGFGTLDQDALDTALETLGSLYQSGKVIGVISHVPALKERISTQIRVTPMTGGRSKIEGPGCHFGTSAEPA